MQNDAHGLSSDSLDIKETIQGYTKNWLWFLFSVVLFLLIGYVYNRYTISEYEAQALIKIQPEEGSSELGFFKDLDLLQGNSNPILDEIEIIKSRSNLIQVVRQLELNTQIFVQGDILESELYNNPPLNLNFLESDSIISISYDFFLELTSEASFAFKDSEGGESQAYTFGSSIETPIGELIITPNPKSIKNAIGKRFHIKISPITVVADAYKDRIIIAPNDKNSYVLGLYLQDRIQKKAKDIINTLIQVYNDNAIKMKKEVADRTSNFIDARIKEISSSLSKVDQSAEDFKTDRGITDIASESNMNLNVGMANRQELENATLQLNMASSMLDMVQNQDEYETLPSNLGLSDQTVAATTARYNQIVAQRNSLLESSSERNPVVQELDKQLNSLKNSLASSLNNTAENLSMQINSLSKQQSQINYRIYSAPGNERELRDITRQQVTTEELYLYLLEKREEAQIAFASASPPSSIIDWAYSSKNTPVYPNKLMTYFIAISLGLLVPFIVIYANELLDNKIHNKVGLEKIVGDIPVLAEIPKVSKKENLLVGKEDRSVLAESIRILQTNLDYLLRSKSKKEKRNIILVTSSVPGEGKTFLSSNLSLTLINSGKKTLLVGADIRNPKLLRFISREQAKAEKKAIQGSGLGLTEYLFDNDITLEEITEELPLNGTTLSMVYSGKVPPNPAELLMKDRLNQFFEEASKIYDYIIVDSAPLLVVADTQLIANHADQILYVTKAGSTENKVLSFPLKLLKEGKIKNLSFVVNNVAASKLGYGGKYGYGYSSSKKKAWWKFGAA
ncbi:GumC family protein [Robiginitalea sp. IMCC44478]|uniref:GumC family protein n=1 Tax=Robiginitalea sp. IMCC44478 TaxID=3459122 RepID=UPI004041323F